MLSNNKKPIAVFGPTVQQGGGVVRALQASGQFKVRALTRNPGAIESWHCSVQSPDHNERKSHWGFSSFRRSFFLCRFSFKINRRRTRIIKRSQLRDSQEPRLDRIICTY
jgi:hypothetical protein